jgi:hypothetical protein
MLLLMEDDQSPPTIIHCGHPLGQNDRGMQVADDGRSQRSRDQGGDAFDGRRAPAPAPSSDAAMACVLEPPMSKPTTRELLIIRIRSGSAQR